MSGLSVTATSPAAPRWVWLTLFASLAVNLVIAGVVLGNGMRPPPPHAGSGFGGRMAGNPQAPFLRQLLLVLVVMLAAGLVELPVSLYRHFVKSANISAHTVEMAVGAYMKLVTGGVN